jgi:hypothetical protein
MRITPAIFDAFLKCATKCHLRSLGETGLGNEYAEWVRGRDESYQREEARRLQETVPEAERVVAPPATENLKAAKRRLAADLVVQTPDNADNHACLGQMKKRATLRGPLQTTPSLGQVPKIKLVLAACLSAISDSRCGPGSLGSVQACRG